MVAQNFLYMSMSESIRCSVLVALGFAPEQWCLLSCQFWGETGCNVIRLLYTAQHATLLQCLMLMSVTRPCHLPLALALAHRHGPNAGVRSLGAGDAEAHGVQPAAAEVSGKQLAEWLTYPPEWGPTEWGPIPFLPDNDILVKRMEKQWGELRTYR